MLVREPTAVAEHRSRLCQLKCDCANGGVYVVIDFTQHDPHHSPSPCLHPEVAVDVIGLDVRVAIELDDQSGLRTSEVSDVRTNRMLAPKLHAKSLSTQSPPEVPLGAGHVSTK